MTELGQSSELKSNKGSSQHQGGGSTLGCRRPFWVTVEFLTAPPLYLLFLWGFGLPDNLRPGFAGLSASREASALMKQPGLQFVFSQVAFLKKYIFKAAWQNIYTAVLGFFWFQVSSKSSFWNHFPSKNRWFSLQKSLYCAHFKPLL